MVISIPVQWKSFEQSLNRFQGEIVDKKGCWKRFSEKLKQVSNGSPPDFTGPEWRDLLAVTDAIRSAFRVADGEDLIDSARSAPE